MGNGWKIPQVPAKAKMHCLDRQQLTLSLKYCQVVCFWWHRLLPQTYCNSKLTPSPGCILAVPMVLPFQHALSRTAIPLSILQTAGLVRSEPNNLSSTYGSEGTATTVRPSFQSVVTLFFLSLQSFYLLMFAKHFTVSQQFTFPLYCVHIPV